MVGVMASRIAALADQLPHAALARYGGCPRLVTMETPCRQVLVIDGDPQVRRKLAGRLSTAGHIVYTAADRADALTYLMEAEIDLIVTEYSMGRTTGREWLRFLRTNFAETEVVIVTALPLRASSARWTVFREPLDLDALEQHLGQAAA